MSIVWWGRHRLIMLLLFCGQRRSARVGWGDHGCAVLCPFGGGPCTLKYRRHWCLCGRLFGATLCVYDTDGMPSGTARPARRSPSPNVTGAEARYMGTDGRG